MQVDKKKNCPDTFYLKLTVTVVSVEVTQAETGAVDVGVCI